MEASSSYLQEVVYHKNRGLEFTLKTVLEANFASFVSLFFQFNRIHIWHITKSLYTPLTAYCAH